MKPSDRAAVEDYLHDLTAALDHLERANRRALKAWTKSGRAL